MSVCLSVTSRTSTGIAKRFLAGFGADAFFHLCYTQRVIRKFVRLSPKIRLLSSGRAKGRQTGVCVCVCSSGRVAPAICVLPFVRNSGLREDFAAASRSRCHQNLSTAELVDHGHDGRRVPAGRTQFICTSVAVML